jgi:hypothetical protein
MSDTPKKPQKSTPAKNHPLVIETPAPATPAKKSYLELFAGIKAEGSLPDCKFPDPGKAIVARMIGRREVNLGQRVAKVADVDILESTDSAELGPHTIWESTDITELFDEHQVNPGDVFYLRFDSVAGRFKKFVLKVIERASAQDGKQDDIPF